MRTLLSLCAAAFATACIVPAPNGDQPSDVHPKAVVNNAPPVEVRVGANLDDKVQLLGATINPSRVSPGEAFRVTLYFKVLEAIPVDYMVFVHVEDVDGRTDRLNADHPPANGQYPTSQWKVGETVKDEFQVYVPPGLTVRGLNLLLGLWDPKTDQRMPLKNVNEVKHDGNNRLLVAQVPVVAQ